MHYPPAVFLMGPTASGKTDLAIQLVDTPLHGRSFEIISVDSALVYRGMDIGTAKPDQSVIEKAPHKLIDICEPDEPYSAARFRHDALYEMNEITARGNIPLLVGGTMLYFRALEKGLSELPKADPQVREALEAEAAQYGLDALYQRLMQIDPESANRIHPNDPQRIQRALEVYEISGETISSLYQRHSLKPIPYNIIKIALAPEDRSVLHEKICKRVANMLKKGFIEEVTHFFNRDDLHKDLPSMRAVGYRQGWEYLEGKLNYAQMEERILIVTRQFAKRQFTWLRADSAITWFNATDKKLLAKVLNYLNTVPI